MVKETNKSVTIRFDDQAHAEKLAPRFQALADRKGISFGRLTLQAIRELLAREEGDSPDIAQMHKTQQVQTGMLESVVSLLGTLSTRMSEIEKRLSENANTD